MGEGATPLGGAPYTRMGGRWSADTDWGKPLRQAEAPVAAPARGAGLAGAGPARASLSSAVTCIAASPCGTWIAVGLADGGCRVWHRRDRLAGKAGRVATRHGDPNW